MLGQVLVVSIFIDHKFTTVEPVLEIYDFIFSNKTVHKVINENIAIPTQNILLQSQSTTRSSRKDSYRQIQCNKDSYKFSFFCQTIKDWNKLSPDITKNTTTESFKGALTHNVLLDTYPHRIK